MSRATQALAQKLEEWQTEGLFRNGDLAIIYDQLCQIIMIAQDEEREKQCPGSGYSTCLKIKGTKCSVA